MRTLLTAFILVVTVNLLAAAGMVGWLGASGRLSKDRVHAAVEVFRPTIQAQQEAEDVAAAEQAEREQVAETALRMEQVAGGPMTPEQVLASINEVDAYYEQLIKRREVEVRAIQDQLDTTRRLVDEQFAQLQQEREAFQQLQQKWLDENSDADFRQAVAMLEGVPARQAKQILQELLEQGDEDQVVAYLAAMQTRMANKVLKEFKAPEEVVQAARLIEQVRLRSGAALEEVGL